MPLVPEKKLMMVSAIPPLSLHVFKKLIYRLSPEEIHKIPLSSLPFNFSSKDFEEENSDLIKLLEEIEININCYNAERYSDDIMHFGESLANAIQNVEYRGILATGKDFIGSVDALSKALNSSDISNSYKLLDQIGKKINNIRTQYAVAVKFIPRIKGEVESGSENNVRLERIIDLFKKDKVVVLDAIHRYYEIRLQLEYHRMKKTNERVIISIVQIKKIDSDILAYQQGIKRISKFWNKTDHTNTDIDELKTQISIELENKKQKIVPIDEDKLIKWLDVLIDMELMPNGSISSSNCSIRTRYRSMICYLLQQYCLQQESAAQDIARNPFTIVDPKKSINFIINSEKIILDYFTNKTNEMTIFLSHVAKNKRDEIDGIRRSLLAELQINT